MVAVVILLTVGMTGVAFGQSERSLRTWVDTLNQPLCGEGAFETWGVWVETRSATDTILGFTLQDSVLSVELTLRWDPTRVQLLPPYILAPVQSLVGRFVSKVQGVDTTTGELFLSASTDQSFRPAVGTGIPLFYLKGRVRPTDSIFVAPEGGARVQRIVLEGPLAENLTSTRHLPGFVQVTRDTTPEYTGSLELTEADIDTVQADTVDVFLRNLGDRRVQTVRFSVSVDTTKVRFAAVLPAVDPNPWSEVEPMVELADDEIKVSIDRDGKGDLPSIDENSSLMSLILERKTDSSFSTSLEVQDFEVNETSCLGKLIWSGGGVIGARIELPVDTTDTTMSVVRDHHGQQNDRGWLVILPNGEVVVDQDVRAIAFYDAMGRLLGNFATTESKRIQLGDNVRLTGPIFATIRLRDGRRVHVKQYIESR